VEVDPPPVDASGVPAEAEEALQPVGQGGDVVVHQPEPVVSVEVGLADAGVEAAGATGVRLQPKDPHDGLVAVRGGQELVGSVGAGVVDDVDRVEGPGLRQQRRQQLRQVVPAVVRDDHGRDRPVLVPAHLLHLHLRSGAA
jgi:hypothetical protein